MPYRTITFVVRADEPQGDDAPEFEDVLALVTPDETMFFSSQPGISREAHILGADPMNWSDDPCRNCDGAGEVWVEDGKGHRAGPVPCIPCGGDGALD